MALPCVAAAVVSKPYDRLGHQHGPHPQAASKCGTPGNAAQVLGCGADDSGGQQRGTMVARRSNDDLGLAAGAFFLLLLVASGIATAWQTWTGGSCCSSCSAGADGLR